MTNKLKPYRNPDPTPYQQWKAEGKSTKDFFGMTLTLLLVIPAFVYVMASVLDPFMHHPITGVIAFGVLVYAVKWLVEACDAKW